MPNERYIGKKEVCSVPSRLHIALAVFVCGATVVLSAPILKSQDKPLTSEQRQIVETMKTVFAALRTDNVVQFNSVTAPDFYIFDGGVRFNGESLLALVGQLHAAGKRYEWSVTEPDVHISGNSAWIAYINRGSITDSSGTVEQQWLESAFLEKHEGTWKIVFMHSTRAAKPLQGNDRK
jgi:ketosteroid isomerase-like protein